MLAGAGHNLKLAHAGCKATVLGVGLVFGCHNHDWMRAIDGESRMSLGRLNDGLAQQPGLKKWHKAIYVLTAGDHLVNAPVSG